MIEVHGQCGIYAKVLADSLAPRGTYVKVPGTRLLSYELQYPRIILAELNTHRMLSKNSHSSRAIPFNKMVEQLQGRPVRFGEANPGMQDTGVDHTNAVRVKGYSDFDSIYDDDGELLYATSYAYLPPELAWEEARDAAIQRSKEFHEAGYHKQVYNRLTESFQMMRTVVSGTEWENYFWLRDHGAADPTLRELTRVMAQAREESTPQALEPGEWHLPYVETIRDATGALSYFIEAEGEDGMWTPISVLDARKVSAARCAAVSFRNLGYGLQKSLDVYERLVGSDRKHASAFEHQGTPMKEATGWVNTGPGPEIEEPYFWEEGVTHMTKDTCLWSGNFKGFVQFRKLIPGENYEG